MGQWTTTKFGGTYTVPDLADDTYKVKFLCETYGLAYLDSWYQDKISTGNDAADFAAASPVVINGTNPSITQKLVYKYGKISGKVTDKNGVGIGNVPVDVYMKGTSSWSYGAVTDGNGDYTITGVDSGTYAVMFAPENYGRPYLDEWWDNKPSTGNIAYDSANASAVVVNPDVTTSANAVLTYRYGNIHGFVRDSQNKPIPGVWVEAWRASTGAEAWTQTDGNGEYTIAGASSLDAGTYKVKFYPTFSSKPYLDEWFDNKAATVPTNDAADFAAATPVPVSPDTTSTASANLTYRYGVIAGTVTDKNGVGIPDVRVEAWNSQSGATLGASTDGNGHYAIKSDNGLERGKYKVKFRPTYANKPYVDEWYNDRPTTGNDTTDYTNATEVTVSAETTTPIDASLTYRYGVVAGKVTNTGANGIAGVKVNVYKDLGGWQGVTLIGSATTNATGDYAVKGATYIEPGDNYKVEFDALTNTTGYPSEWYKDVLSTGARDTDFAKAAAVSVGADATTTVNGILGDQSSNIPPVVSSDAKLTYSGTATITISATDADDQVVSVSYSIDDGAIQTVIGSTAQVVVRDWGGHWVEYWATDDRGMASSHTTKYFDVYDADLPTAPGAFSYVALTSTSVSLVWTPSTDSISGLAGYELKQDGYLVDEFDSAATSRLVNELTPGQTYTFTLVALDNSGNRSPAATLVITTPLGTQTGSGNVGTGSGVSTTVTVPGGGDVGVTFGGTVTNAGQLNILMASKPTWGDPTGYRLVGPYPVILFNGTFTGNALITIPYDYKTPVGRVSGLKVAHWTGSAWEMMADAMPNPTTRTISFTVTGPTNFGLYAVCESTTVNRAVTMFAGFTKYSNTASTFTSGYHKAVSVYARVRGDHDGAWLPYKKLIVEKYVSAAVGWVKVCDAPPLSASSGDYRAVFTAPYAKTTYRVRLLTDAFNDEKSSANRAVYPQVNLTKPSIPTRAYYRRAFTVYGTIAPAHTRGTVPVVVKLYRYYRGRWVYVKAFNAKMVSTSKWQASIVSPYRGYVRMCAYAKADAAHAATTSVYTSRFTVR